MKDNNQKKERTGSRDQDQDRKAGVISHSQIKGSDADTAYDKDQEFPNSRDHKTGEHSKKGEDSAEG